MKLSSLTLLLLYITLSSCGNIRNKSKEIASDAEQKIKDKSKTIIDKAFPQFDSDIPDTEFNRKRFTEYLEVDLAPDVKNIYCYADFLGIDYKVLISFTCDAATIQKIIERKNMKPVSDERDSGLGFSEKFDWWDSKKTYSLRPYKKGKENEYW